jgi:hypothetical protein
MMMAKGTPRRTTSPGKGAAQMKAPKGNPVGYGDKGGKFFNQKKYNVSKSGQAHAKNPSLSKKPVGYGKEGNAFFSPAKYEASKAGKAAGGHFGGQAPPQQAHHSAATTPHYSSSEVSKPVPAAKAVGMTIKSIVRK